VTYSYFVAELLRVIFFEGCGPATLNAVVRKAVATQIDPSRLRMGDKSGSIDVVVEEFGF